jgi:hypothetical protein
MSAQRLLNESSRNLQTFEELQALVRHVGSLDQVKELICSPGHITPARRAALWPASDPRY